MHRIDIPRAIIEQVLRRRGRLAIHDSLAPARTALLVIDMQNCFLDPNYSIVTVPGLADIVANINRLASACRRVGATVVWTQHCYTEGWRSWFEFFATPEVRAKIIAESRPGSFGFALAADMEVAASDWRVVKTRSSPFTPGSSDLHQRLQGAGIDTVIVTGTLTNVCCESAARDAMLLDYATLFAADATGARSDAEHNATLVNMLQFFADVRTCDELVGLLENTRA
ncbi:MAG: cysteine hydrolase [Alphaproteobacteria bacterium]|nr:cysteine hydrolase [Alphaproteobacteria bacterium]